MSSIDTQRIKGLREISSCLTEDGQVKSTLPPMVPFGTDGYLVDMLSQLDLEEQLKLGGSHWTEIENNIDEENHIDETIIKEWFFNQSIDENTDKDSCSYSLITVINNNALDVFLNVGKQQGSDQDYDIYLLDTEEGELPVSLITVEDVDYEPSSVISIELYKNNCQQQNITFLWKKDIILKAEIEWEYEIGWDQTMEGYEDHRQQKSVKYSIIQSLSQNGEQENDG